MPLIWCSISAHGFGHAAQVVPVLNELGRQVPELKVTFRTMVPAAFFRQRLTIPFTISAAEQDIGCVQHGPLHIDVHATWEKHRRFHRTWSDRVADEARAMRLLQPDLVLSDIPYVAVAAAARLRATCVGLCSLSWDRVLELLIDPQMEDQKRILDEIVTAYGTADLAIRPMPGLGLPAFQRVRDVGPIADPLAPRRNAVRQAIRASDGERVVLIGFGGIALESLPFERLEHMIGYRFILSGAVPLGLTRVVSDSALAMPFRTLLASADVIMTKPGYSTIVEAVAAGIPAVYVRRYNFADEQSLVDYLHRYGRGVELSSEDFAQGRWESAIKLVSDSPLPNDSPYAATGAKEAADILAGLLTGGRG